MALITSVSGIRGTIGGLPGMNLTPPDVVRFSAALATWMLRQGLPARIAVGRDGRTSGPMVQGLVQHTLMAMGVDVVDLGITTTPTLEMAVPREGAGAGIMLTASHNPAEWNALKLLNQYGEFLSESEGMQVLDLASSGSFSFAPADRIGRHFLAGDYLDYHIEKIIALGDVDAEAIRNARFTVVVDTINSSGAIAIPRLLEALGVRYHLLNPEVTGQFAHNPEPLPAHLSELCRLVPERKADLGIAVDPDVDRLAFVAEDGSWFGEEYTLVAAADHILSRRPGPVVSNLSSSRALTDLARRYGQPHYTSAVGEVHVVRRMKETGAVLGGEGNGGVILPDLHYGRDALLGIALTLSLLASRSISMCRLRQSYPDYAMAKLKMALPADFNWEAMRQYLRQTYLMGEFNESDGIKIDLDEGWLHIRKSNTEPILRIYSEAKDPSGAEKLAREALERLEQHVALTGTA